MLKAAVIGVGNMGKNHLRILSELPDVKLVCCADRDQKLLDIASKKYGIKTYSDYNEMIDSEEIDFISIVVPTVLHKQVAIDCLNAGINVLLEKPIASTSAEALEIIAAAKKNDVLLTIGHLERFNPAVLELRRRIMDGEIGDVYQVEADRLGPYPAGRMKDCGVVIDLAVHDLDIFNFLLNSDVRHVFANTEKRIHSSNEDLVLAMLKFENNVLGTIKANWLTPTKRRKLRVTGDKGMFEVDYITQDLTYHENASKENDADSNTPFTISEGKRIKYFIQKKEPLRLEIESFVDAILNKEAPAISPEDATRALHIAEKIIESGESNEVLEIDRL